MDESPKLPLRVDLREYAAWISGRDPFGEDVPTKTSRRRAKAKRSLEMYLADLCSHASGGRTVQVEDMQSLLARYPTLLVLDGLDEVADPELRTIIVGQINDTARRMGSGDRQIRRFQIIVTARPNASGLAEPDPDLFQTLRLEPLNPALQAEFVNRWCDVRGIESTERQRLRRIFRERTALDHVAQLADNPMQLTILLFLINRKGDAVPVARTALYTEYMTTLLDREVNRQQIDRDEVPRVQEVTAFLGWFMHSGVESSPEVGRMSKDDIETTLLLYFRRTDGPHGEVEKLFKAASDRFWALSSKVDGTFEFAVQPVREYFAARFLAEWAARHWQQPLLKQDVLRELIARPYWLNVARFYAGFASPNELAALRYGLEDALQAAAYPLQERSATWTLLADGVFTNNTAVQRDVVRLLADDLTVSLVGEAGSSDVNFPKLTPGAGGEQLAKILRERLESAPSDPLAATRTRVLRDHSGIDKQEFGSWWLACLSASLGTADASAWLHLGATYGRQRVPAEIVEKLDIRDLESRRCALTLGIEAERRTETARLLLDAVLGGHASDTEANSLGEAGLLLRAMRPQWFHPAGRDQASSRRTFAHHLELTDTQRGARVAAWDRLVQIDERYGLVRAAARKGLTGRKGTTEPWQSSARELARIHGPSWLSVEIAVAGAANLDLHASGTKTTGGEPFGDDVDYGTFVAEVHRRPAANWWRDMYDRYDDVLSRRAWALALIAAGRDEVVTELIHLADEVLSALSDEDFLATAASSSRVGLAGKARRLALSYERRSDLSPRTQMLLAHHYGSESELRTLPMLSDEQIASLASSHPAVWPVAQAIAARMLGGGNDALLVGLARLGATFRTGFRQDVAKPERSHLQKILRRPGGYPTEWVAAAERWTTANDQPTLEHLALSLDWVPKIPRL